MPFFGVLIGCGEMLQFHRAVLDGCIDVTLLHCNPRVALESELRAAFWQQVQAMSGRVHPNIARLYGAAELELSSTQRLQEVCRTLSAQCFPHHTSLEG